MERNFIHREIKISHSSYLLFALCSIDYQFYFTREMHLVNKNRVVGVVGKAEIQMEKPSNRVVSYPKPSSGAKVARISARGGLQFAIQILHK